MHVVATAGHVDHGKSTLVGALTGQQPDRLAEERRRGLSIELGYCWTSIDPIGEVAFVDVPGHERFIATTLAGIGPVPVVMFVVAADDPWMPQAAEHLAAVDALGVRHGVLVVTRSDLRDPAGALAVARAELARTSLRDVPAVVVSGATGAGLDELSTALAAALAKVPVPTADADVRLWVDRRFHVRGAGTVVTGTLVTGTVHVGATLSTSDGARVRVRSLEALEHPREEVAGVARVALNVTGEAASALGRGAALLTPAAFEVSDLVDVRVDDAAALPREPVLHLGTAATTVHVRPLGDGHARLRLRQRLPLRVGDRLLLRDPGSREVWGAEVLDPRPPPMTRRGDARSRGDSLTSYDATLAAELSRRGPVELTTLRRLGVDAESRPAGVVEAAGWLVDTDHVEALRTRLRALVEAADPQLGVSVAEATRLLDLPRTELTRALVGAPLDVTDGRIVDVTAIGLDAATMAALLALRQHVQDDRLAAPDVEQMRALGLDAGTVGRLSRAGQVVALPGGLVLLPGFEDAAVGVLAGIDSPFSVSEARQALGVSRRVALAILAHLDRTARTVRLADDRRRMRD